MITSFIILVIGFRIVKNRSKLSSADLRQALVAGATLVDVRSPREYRMDRAIGAVNIPLSILETAIPKSLKKELPIYVYCRSGARASVARRILMHAGYLRVINVGGISNLQRLGIKKVKE